jgi:two-component system chemotaxis response regulator CheB
MSAGGLTPLRSIVTALPPGFPGALVIAHHVASPSILPALIQGWTHHDARFVEDGVPLESGVIYVSPAQRHVIINPDATLGISLRDKINFVRPSIDWLFETAAASYTDRAIAIVLSGSNSDSARGVRHIARSGGMVIVQTPGSCQYPQMPLAAAETGMTHLISSERQIAAHVMAKLADIENRFSRSAVEEPFTSLPAAASA